MIRGGSHAVGHAFDSLAWPAEVAQQPDASVGCLRIVDTLGAMRVVLSVPECDRIAIAHQERSRCLQSRACW